jgi:hypothetical protein
MYVAGSTTSQMAAQLNGQPLSSLLAILTQGVPGSASPVKLDMTLVRRPGSSMVTTPTVSDEAAIIRALLQQRGVSSLPAVAAYQSEMFNTQSNITRRLIFDDARRTINSH